MHPGDAALSPIPDVPSGDEMSDHGTPKRHPRDGAKVSVFIHLQGLGSSQLANNLVNKINQGPCSVNVMVLKYYSPNIKQAKFSFKTFASSK